MQEITGLEDANCKVWQLGDGLWTWRVLGYDGGVYPDLTQALWAALMQVAIFLHFERMYQDAPQTAVLEAGE